MKFLTDRKEIAQEINLNGTPVLTVDISKCMDGYADCYEGSNVRILGGHSKGYEDLDTRCTVMMFGDEPGNEDHTRPWMYKKIILRGGAVCLNGSFGLHDVDEMVKWSNTKVLKAGDPVILFFRGKEMGHLRMMKIGKRIDPFCSTVTTLADIDE